MRQHISSERTPVQTDRSPSVARPSVPKRRAYYARHRLTQPARPYGVECHEPLAPALGPTSRKPCGLLWVHWASGKANRMLFRTAKGFIPFNNALKTALPSALLADGGLRANADGVWFAMADGAGPGAGVLLLVRALKKPVHDSHISLRICANTPKSPKWTPN